MHKTENRAFCNARFLVKIPADNCQSFKQRCCSGSESYKRIYTDTRSSTRGISMTNSNHPSLYWYVYSALSDARICFILSSPNPCSCCGYLVVGIISPTMCTGADVLRMEINSVSPARIRHWIVRSVSSRSHASIALFNKYTLISILSLINIF